MIAAERVSEPRPAEVSHNQAHIAIKSPSVANFSEDAASSVFASRLALWRSFEESYRKEIQNTLYPSKDSLAPSRSPSMLDMERTLRNAKHDFFSTVNQASPPPDAAPLSETFNPTNVTPLDGSADNMDSMNVFTDEPDDVHLGAPAAQESTIDDLASVALSSVSDEPLLPASVGFPPVDGLASESGPKATVADSADFGEMESDGHISLAERISKDVTEHDGLDQADLPIASTDFPPVDALAPTNLLESTEEQEQDDDLNKTPTLSQSQVDTVYAVPGSSRTPLVHYISTERDANTSFASSFGQTGDTLGSARTSRSSSEFPDLPEHSRLRVHQRGQGSDTSEDTDDDDQERPEQPAAAEEPPSLTLSIFSRAWLNMPWRHRLLTVLASLGINLVLPFVNGVMLGEIDLLVQRKLAVALDNLIGFGEIFAREWVSIYYGIGPRTYGAERRPSPANTSTVGVRAAGAAGGGNVRPRHAAAKTAIESFAEQTLLD